MAESTKKHHVLWWILGAVGVLILAIFGVAIYQLFFEFNSKKLDGYIKQLAANYQDPAAAETEIRDGVNHILMSWNLTRQAKDYASKTNIEPEQALANAGLQQAVSLGYLQAAV